MVDVHIIPKKCDKHKPPFNHALSSLVDQAHYRRERDLRAARTALASKDTLTVIRLFQRSERHRRILRSLEDLIPLSGDGRRAA